MLFLNKMLLSMLISIYLIKKNSRSIDSLNSGAPTQCLKLQLKLCKYFCLYFIQMIFKLGLEELLYFGGMKHTKAKKLSGLLLMISLLVLIYISVSQLMRIRNMLPNGDFFQYLKLNLYLNRFKINNPMISRARVLSYSLFGNNWEMYRKAVESVANEAAEDSLYHNWTVRIYHDNYITKALELEN